MSSMSDKRIKEIAEAVAHSFSSACRNRPKAIAVGHGRACEKLANAVENAMKAARDGDKLVEAQEQGRNEN